ncbi:MAG: cytochrome c1 [Alphaproteobacteria bacterium]|nr:cytochrome c1 [Alphaproteobacteria bacterium]HCP01803.1 cytochrome c1 [Rhodospirillaceae bacterium]
MRRTAAVAGFAVAAALVSTSAIAAGDAKHPEDREWPFEGIFGTVDLASAQRGLQVYLEVCSGCHSLKHVAYRNLGALGFSEAEIKVIASGFDVPDGPDKEGEMFERAAIPSDRFVSPFPNEEAAKAANNGARPPDLSLQVKAHPGGANYLHALLTGYVDAPEGVNVPTGSNYNPFFRGGFIAMPAPLFEDGVEYADGTPATVEQMATDVVNFMQWAAEPEMEQRKKTGFKVVIFLIILSAILYAGKRKMWANVDH